MKKALAKLIADKLDDKQKKQMIQAFYDKNKHRPDVDSLVENIKIALNYDKDDVPEI